MRRIMIGSFVAALLVASVAAAQTRDPEAPAHTGFTVTPPSGAYVMGFHTCSSDCENPVGHTVRLVQSQDGVVWTDVVGWKPLSGSVPDVIRRGNTLYVIGAGLTRIDMTTGKATADYFKVKKADGKSALARDVSFAGQLSDGRFVVAYVPSMQDVVGAAAIPVQLAVEDVGSNGSTYTFTGTAISIGSTSLPVPGQPTDPDIFFNGTQWVLYVSVGANVVSFTSSSISGPYDTASATVVSSNAGGVPAGVQSDGGVMAFVNSGPTRDSLVIKRAVSATGTTPLPSSAFTTVLTGAAYGATTAESPGIARNTPGIECGTGCSGTTTTTATTTPAKAGRLGSRCTTADKQGTWKGTLMVCKKVKGKLVWTRA